MRTKQKESKMFTIHDMHTSCAQGLVIDGKVYSIAPPPPSPILSIDFPLPDIPDASFLPTNTAPRVSPVRKPRVTRTVVKKSIVRDTPKRKREEWMQWINWNLAED